MIYTCYEMVQDCRAGKPEGWSFFAAQYVPVIQKLVAHYGSPRADGPFPIEQILTASRRPESALFSSIEPGPERTFVAQLRQWLLGQLEHLDPQPAPDLEVDLETMSTALQPFTFVERQAVWLETMRYDSAAAGVMLRMDPHTVEKIRTKAGDCIRASVDNWRRTLLAENGSPLRRAAAAADTQNCFPAKAFLDMLDGRTAWRGREEMERHGTTCWHCIDHFCRMLEVVELLRGLQPLTIREAEPFRAALGLSPAAKAGRRHWFAGS